MNRARQNNSAQLCYFSSVNMGWGQVESRNQKAAADIRQLCFQILPQKILGSKLQELFIQLILKLGKKF